MKHKKKNNNNYHILSNLPKFYSINSKNQKELRTF